jgi:uncharacterized protein
MGIPEMKPLSGLLALLMMTGAAQSASFNCNLAKSRVERSICGNAQLSRLDESLASAYLSARNSLSTQKKNLCGRTILVGPLHIDELLSG